MKVISVNVGKDKGGRKKPKTFGFLKKGFGLLGDTHAL